MNRYKRWDNSANTRPQWPQQSSPFPVTYCKITLIWTTKHSVGISTVWCLLLLCKLQNCKFGNVTENMVFRNTSRLWRSLEELCMSSVWIFVKPLTWSPHNIPLSKMQQIMDLMGGLFGGQGMVGGWLHPESSGQWFNVQMEITDKGHSSGVHTGTSAV